MAVVKFRNGGAIEERQAMKLSERIRDLIVMSVDLANPIHWSSLKNHFPKRRLDTKPDRADKAGDDHSDDCLEGIALRLLNASAPTAQMLKIRAQLFSILFLEAK